MTDPRATIQALQAIVGPAHVIHEGDRTAWDTDWRKRYHGRSLAVVRPASTAEVAQVVACCAARGISIIPQGGNTGLVGGGVPDASGHQVVLSLQRMHAVRAVDVDNLAITVEAGCILQTLQSVAIDHGLWFPLSLAAEGSCTLGGNLATNAGGTQVLRFGNARDLCLGLEVVTADGHVMHGLKGLRKDNTGYDLRHLMIGSEGTLGIITAATMKLVPRPAATMTAMASCQTLSQTVALLALAQRQLSATLTGFEVMNALSLALVAKHMPQLRQPLPAAPWTVLLEASDPDSAEAARHRFETLLEGALGQGVIDDAAVAESVQQSKTMWHLRESIPLAQAEEGHNIKHDVSLPVSRIVAFCTSVEAQLASAIPGMRLVNFGHLGDGNLHFNVQAPTGGDASEFLRLHEAQVNAIVYDGVDAHDGSMSAEHGVGALKVHELEVRKDPTALAIMRSIKAALDPKGTLNPGRMIR